MSELNSCQREWKQRGTLLHCDFCGSIDVPTALILLVTKGVEYSGSDWKYGWPHKFYLKSQVHGHLKFYASHLAEATEDQLILFNRVAEDTLGISYQQSQDGLMYHAPAQGYQASGIVGGPRRQYL